MGDFLSGLFPSLASTLLPTDSVCILGCVPSVGHKGARKIQNEQFCGEEHPCSCAKNMI